MRTQRCVSSSFRASLSVCRCPGESWYCNIAILECASTSVATHCTYTCSGSIFFVCKPARRGTASTTRSAPCKQRRRTSAGRWQCVVALVWPLRVIGKASRPFCPAHVCALTSLFAPTVLSCFSACAAAPRAAHQGIQEERVGWPQGASPVIPSVSCACGTASAARACRVGPPRRRPIPASCRWLHSPRVRILSCCACLLSLSLLPVVPCASHALAMCNSSLQRRPVSVAKLDAHRIAFEEAQKMLAPIPDRTQMPTFF